MTDDLNLDYIKHTAQLAFSREQEVLSEEALVELFDSIDSLTLDELSRLHAVLCIGVSGKTEEMNDYILNAKETGYELASQIFNNPNLGSLLIRGLNELGS